MGWASITPDYTAVQTGEAEHLVKRRTRARSNGLDLEARVLGCILDMVSLSHLPSGIFVIHARDRDAAHERQTRNLTGHSR
jgi:hypothetical protein